MFASNYINDSLPVLKPGDTCKTAINWFEEFHTDQLIVADKGKYFGILTEQDLMDFNNENALIENLPLSHSQIYVREQQHFFDVIKTALNHHLKLVPVLNDNNIFMGLITYKDLFKAIAENCSLNQDGSILVLGLEQNKIILSEIAKIIENFNSKILSFQISSKSDADNLHYLTLKINKIDISDIILAFEKNNFKIISYISETRLQEYQKERYNALMKYLQIG